MKIKKLNSLKIFGVALAASSAGIATATLASCSKTNRFNAIGGDLDREYNVSEATYKALQGQFKLKLENQLKDQDPDVRARKMKALAQSLSSINQSYASNKKYSYSLLSSMLVEKARRQYGIKLVTESSAQWSDIKDMFDGMKHSLDAYMTALRMDRNVIDLILSEADNKYKLMMEGSEDKNVVGIRQKYDDPLSGFIQARNSIITCFEETNGDIALLAATKRLQEFLSDYTIIAKDTVKLDRLENEDWFHEGADLSSKVNEIFTVVRNDDNQQITNFSPTMFPGYVLKPVLSSVSRDGYSNAYSLNVDWTCQKADPFINKNIDPNKTVAHTLKPASELSCNVNSLASIEELNDILGTLKSPIPYPISLSAEKEKEVLQEVYFGKESKSNQYTKYIKFDWDKDLEKCGFEAFFQGEQTDKDGKQFRIPLKSLADSGLTMQVIDRQTNNEINKPVRVDSMLSSWIIGTSSSQTEQSNNDDLLTKLLENCDIESNVTIIDDTNKKASNQLVVSYKNTKSKDDASYQFKSVDTNDFGTSPQIYAYLTRTYNNLSNALDPYITQDYENELSDIESEANITLALLILSSIFAGATVLQLIFNPLVKSPSYWFVWVLTAISMTCQGLDYHYIKEKQSALQDFVDKLNKFTGSNEVQAFKQMLDSDVTKYSLIRGTRDPITSVCVIDKDSFQIGKDAFGALPYAEGEICKKEILERYQTIKHNTIYKNFINKTRGEDVSPEDYKEIMKPYLPGGAYWYISTACTVTSLICDIVAMKLAPAPAKEQAGEIVAKDEEKDVIKLDAEFDEVERIRNNDSLIEKSSFSSYDQGKAINDQTTLGAMSDLEFGAREIQKQYKAGYQPIFDNVESWKPLSRDSGWSFRTHEQVATDMGKYNYIKRLDENFDLGVDLVPRESVYAEYSDFIEKEYMKNFLKSDTASEKLINAIESRRSLNAQIFDITCDKADDIAKFEKQLNQFCDELANTRSWSMYYDEELAALREVAKDAVQNVQIDLVDSLREFKKTMQGLGKLRESLPYTSPQLDVDNFIDIICKFLGENVNKSLDSLFEIAKEGLALR